MSTKWYIFVCAAMLTGSVFAAEPGTGAITPNLDKGTKVLEGAGQVNMMADEAQIQVAYGQFIADGLEVGILAGLRDNDFYTSYELGARAEYNFVGESALVPFLSTSILWANAEVEDSDLEADAAVWSLGAGMKYFIRDDVALAADGSYLLSTDDIYLDSEDGELQDDEVRLLLSVRFYFD